MIIDIKNLFLPDNFEFLSFNHNLTNDPA